MSAQAYYELYRGSSLGLSLTDTLDDLINEGRIEPQLAMKILSTFDRIITEVLADKVRARLTFKGHLDTYRFCDEVWTFLIKDVNFKLDNQTQVQADKVKIVSCAVIAMPRTLPWLTGSSGGAKDTTPRRRPVKRERDIKKDDEDETTPKAKLKLSSSEVGKRYFFRSSPTPPSSPIHRCPSEEFLIEGLDNDDIYMMVEDEFYAVAQTFTQHLHYAEYVRRKKEAKLQNAAAIQDLARPTDGVTPMSEETKRQREADALSTRQKDGLGQIQSGRPAVDSDESDDVEEDVALDDTFAGTSLHDLLMSPRKAKSLVGMQGVKSATRAAAGFSESSDTRRDSTERDNGRDGNHDVEETASEDDDLDAQARTPTMTAPHRRTQVISSDSYLSNQRSSPLSSRSDQDRAAKGVRPVETKSKYKAPPALQSRKRRLFDDFDELPELHTSYTQTKGGSTSSINKTQQKIQNDNNLESKKKSRLNEVPTFLL
ncbi:uncharacterized protein KD926_002029 [Aspergillus affinis]|uniref:uncharacterized protein n=1 Tax=Aspergillus affinis TaxID=1070780 RepID=UPI0022FE91F2|nr:uncharacterized protein KD926_002029 [Aspergillus affinis]KAI9036375.1 hypothetical protein KD926_002029 [Aspergillus affinis]